MLLKSCVLLIHGEIITLEGKILHFIQIHMVDRIDFFLCVSQHIHKVLTCGIETITVSHHAPITLTVDMGKESFF